MRVRFTGVLMAIFALLGASAPAFAHHGFGVEFDGSKCMYLKGTLSGIDWENPHAYLQMDVTDADGKVIRSRGTLGVMDRAVRQVERDQIGECTADIECNDQRQRSSPHGRQKGSIFLLVSPKGASRIPLARGPQT